MERDYERYGRSVPRDSVRMPWKFSFRSELMTLGSRRAGTGLSLPGPLPFTPSKLPSPSSPPARTRVTKRVRAVVRARCSDVAPIRVQRRGGIVSRSGQRRMRSSSRASRMARGSRPIRAGSSLRAGPMMSKSGLSMSWISCAGCRARHRDGRSSPSSIRGVRPALAHLSLSLWLDGPETAPVDASSRCRWLSTRRIS